MYKTCLKVNTDNSWIQTYMMNKTSDIYKNNRKKKQQVKS
jgi:hypothetical protein